MTSFFPNDTVPDTGLPLGLGTPLRQVHHTSCARHAATTPRSQTGLYPSARARRRLLLKRTSDGESLQQLEVELQNIRSARKSEVRFHALHSYFYYFVSVLIFRIRICGKRHVVTTVSFCYPHPLTPSFRLNSQPTFHRCLSTDLLCLQTSATPHAQGD